MGNQSSFEVAAAQNVFFQSEGIESRPLPTASRSSRALGERWFGRARARRTGGQGVARLRRLQTPSPLQESPSFRSPPPQPPSPREHGSLPAPQAQWASKRRQTSGNKTERRENGDPSHPHPAPCPHPTVGTRIGWRLPKGPTSRPQTRALKGFAQSLAPQPCAFVVVARSRSRGSGFWSGERASELPSV